MKWIVEEELFLDNGWVYHPCSVEITKVMMMTLYQTWKCVNCGKDYEKYKSFIELYSNLNPEE